MAMRTIVYAPHVCVVSPLQDPGCDRQSRTYARALAASLGARCILSRTRRAECDNNRRACRYTTPSRRRLRSQLERPAFVLEVHTFDRDARPWDLPVSPDVVILETHKTPYVRRLAAALRARNVEVAVLRGSLQNDVQQEVASAGSQGLLLELAQGLPARRLARVCGAVTAVLAGA